jgi:hypothetical protein
VKEPDYEPEKIRQIPEVTQIIEKIGEIILSFWEQRETEKYRIQEGKEYDERSRRIFYDTDQISESQLEGIRVCPDCAGALRIDSTSSRGYHILAVHIPRKACKDCMETGYQWYESADRGNFDHIFLQDRTNDTYSERK